MSVRKVLFLAVVSLGPLACLCLITRVLCPQRATFRGHTGRVLGVVASPDGKTLASLSEDTTIKLWDVATGKERATLQGHTDGVFFVVYSPDGKTLAARGIQALELWDVATGKEWATVKGYHFSHSPSSVVFSPDGKALASGDEDGTIKLWDVATGK